MLHSALRLLLGHAASLERGHGLARVIAKPHRSPTRHAVSFTWEKVIAGESVIDDEMRTTSRFKTSGLAPLILYFIIQVSSSIVNISVHEKQAKKQPGHSTSAVILLLPHGPYMTRLHFVCEFHHNVGFIRSLATIRQFFS